MTTYKWNDGTAGGFAHVLTVADDGRRTIEIRVNGRAIRYDDVEERPCEYCRGTRLHYGKGSSMPWTNAKGERWPQWEPLTETETAAESDRWRPIAQPTTLTATAATETAQTEHNGDEWARQMFRRPFVRELAKGAGILTALAIIWQTGLLIPFALLGGVAAGVVK